MICAADDSIMNGSTLLKTHLGDGRLHVCDDAVHALDSLLHLNARFALNLQHSSAGFLFFITQYLHHLLLGFPLDVQLNLLTSSLQLFHNLPTPIPTSDLALHLTNIGFNAVLHICILFCYQLALFTYLLIGSTRILRLEQTAEHSTCFSNPHYLKEVYSGYLDNHGQLSVHRLCSTPLLSNSSFRGRESHST